MGKILLFVSFLIVLLSAVLGFLNKGKYSEVLAKASEAEEALKAKSTELTAKDKALTEATGKVATITAEKEQIQAQVASATSAAETAKSQVADLTSKVTAAEEATKAKEAELAAANQKLVEASTNSAASQTPTSSPDDKAMIEELKTVNAKLQGDVDSLKVQVDAAQKIAADRAALKMRDGVEGRVLAVNPAWNFVVLNLGDKQGVVNNAELLVKRGRQLVGKVRITSVEPSTSIADIVANSVPSGTVISPGDNVIFQTVEE